MAGEGIVPASDFRFGPYPGDTLYRRSANMVEYRTPADSDGMGTVSRLAKTHEPIAGVAILDRADMNVLKLDVRLPAELRDRIAVIFRSVEAGDWSPKLGR